MGEVAERFQLTLAELLERNPYLNPDYYLPGQTIILPRDPGAGEETMRYRTRRGERLADILRRFECSVAEVRQLNPELDVFNIREGTELTLKKPEGSYEIQPGETLSSLAEKFSTDQMSLLRQNQHLRPAEFVPGQRIRTEGRDFR